MNISMFLVRYGDHLLWADLADPELWEQLLVREARRTILILPVPTTTASPGPASDTVVLDDPEF